MTLTISLSSDAESLLRRRAEAAGKAAGEYAAELVERAVSQPTLAEILAPVHEEFRQSGMSETQLDDVLRKSVDASRHSRPPAPGGA